MKTSIAKLGEARPASKQHGFSLIELLLVLAIIAIISAIAIPSFLGQRRRARIIGDANANAQVLRMAMEARKAETGVYAASGLTLTWTATGTTPSASTNPAPAFVVKGASKMDYKVVVGNGGLSYLLNVTDPKMGNSVVIQTDQAGRQLDGSATAPPGVVGLTAYQKL